MRTTGTVLAALIGVNIGRLRTDQAHAALRAIQPR